MDRRGATASRWTAPVTMLAAAIAGAALTFAVYARPLSPALARLTVLGVAVDLVVNTPHHPSPALAAAVNAVEYALAAGAALWVVRRLHPSAARRAQ